MAHQEPVFAIPPRGQADLMPSWAIGVFRQSLGSVGLYHCSGQVAMRWQIGTVGLPFDHTNQRP